MSYTHEQKVGRARTIDELDEHRGVMVIGSDGQSYLVPSVVLEAMTDVLLASNGGNRG